MSDETLCFSYDMPYLVCRRVERTLLWPRKIRIPNADRPPEDDNMWDVNIYGDDFTNFLNRLFDAIGCGPDDYPYDLYVTTLSFDEAVDNVTLAFEGLFDDIHADRGVDFSAVSTEEIRDSVRHTLTTQRRRSFFEPPPSVLRRQRASKKG